MSEEFPRRTGNVIARFSCGAASAVATRMAVEKYGPTIRVCYNDTGSEHPDNERFILDCEKWFGVKVEVLKSKKYADTWEVWEKQRFLVSPKGAPCTSEMKRIPGEEVWSLGDVEVFGYTVDEGPRLQRFKADNPERIIECPLIDAGISKADCFGILTAAGIRIPEMYALGFKNNNCIACVKARDAPNYWKRIRKYFPSHFARMAALERELGFAINRVKIKGKKVQRFLDELPPGDPKEKDEVKISCGLFCAAETEKDND